MADPTPDEQPDLDQPLAPAPEPEASAPDPLATFTEAVETPEPQPDPPPAASPPEPSATDLRFQQLSQENAQMRDLLAQAQSALVQRQQPPPPDPFADPNLSPEWKQSLQLIDQKLAPVIEQRIRQIVQPLMQQTQQATVMAEAGSLRNKYADFATHEADVFRAQQDYARQTGQVVPLELAYMFVRGAKGLQATPQQVSAAEQRGVKRARAAANGTMDSATPAPTTPRGGLTAERIKAMSNDEIIALAERYDLPV